jgi:hypothetical protein
MGPQIKQNEGNDQPQNEKNEQIMQGIDLNENVVNEGGNRDAWLQAAAPIEPIQPNLNEFPQQQLVADFIDLNALASMEVDYSDHDTV